MEMVPKTFSLLENFFVARKVLELEDFSYLYELKNRVSECCNDTNLILFLELMKDESLKELNNEKKDALLGNVYSTFMHCHIQSIVISK